MNLRNKFKSIYIGSVEIGAEPVIISGPCSVESEQLIVEIAKEVKSAGATILRGGAFKPRTKPESFQGLGLEGLRYLATAKAETGLPVVTEVVDVRSMEAVARVADMLQIGARNMYNYSLLKEAGMTGLPVLLKRGFSARIEEWLGAAEYIGHDKIVFCERGVRSFDQSTRNVLDLAAVALVQGRTHLPVIVDPSHGTGKRHLVEPMARAAVAAGAHGLMVESHINPDQSISDSEQTINMETLRRIVKFTKTIYHNNM